MALEREIQVYFAKEGVKHTYTASDEVTRRPYNAFRVTSRTSDSVFADSVRGGDATGFWVGHYLVAVNCNAVPDGEARKITASTVTTGEFTMASAFSALVAVGDIFTIVRKASPNEGGVEFAPDINNIVRNVLGRGLDPAVPISILQGVTAKITSHVMGVAAYPAADTDIGLPPMSDLFVAAMGSVTLNAPSVVSGGASTVRIIDIAATKHEQFDIGNAVMVEDVNAAGSNILDEVRWIVGKKNDAAGPLDQLFVKPDFTVAPADTKRVYGSATFGLLDSGHPKVTVEIYQPDTSTAGQEIILHNCLANFEIGQEASGLLEVTFDLNGGDMKINTLPAGHFSRTITDSEVDEEPSFGPVRMLSGEFSFRTASGADVNPAAYSTTLRDITNFKLTPGNTIARKRTMNSSTGVSTPLISGRNPQLTLSAYFEGAFVDLSDLTGATIKDVHLQLGAQKGADLRTIAAIRVPYAVINSYGQGTQDGLITLDLTLGGAQDSSAGFEDDNIVGATASENNATLIQDSFRIALF